MGVRVTAGSSGGGGASLIHQASRTLDNDTIKNLSTGPIAGAIAIIPTPGANRALRLIAGNLFFDWTADYGNYLAGSYTALKTTGGIEQFSNQFAVADLVAPGGDLIITFTPAYYTIDSGVIVVEYHVSASAMANLGLGLAGCLDALGGTTPLTDGDPANTWLITIEFRVWDLMLGRYLTTAESGWNPDTRTFN